MESVLARTWEMLIGRVHGPFAFRLVVQPLVATFFAARAAISDARAGRPPYGWALLTNPRRSPELIRECKKDISKVFVAAVVIDLIYEVVVFRRIYPGTALIVATVLAALPYPLIRGSLNRIIRLWRRYLGKRETTVPAEKSASKPDSMAKGQS
ncbi:MAG TPA: hypothetical protein VGK96_01595 [Candidatus Sulfotelmatobacter sp.]